MLISLNWIKEFVDLGTISVNEAAQALTLSTAEVDRVHDAAAALQSIVVGKVLSVNAHPQSERLKLVDVDIGSNAPVSVVCGANNVYAGMFSAYAKVGLTLPNGLKLEARSIRGVVSAGMLCSERELGLGENHDGILDLKGKLRPGDTLIAALGLSTDAIIEIDNKSLTHRPDLWGHLGFAREFSAIFRKDLKVGFDSAWERSLEKKFTSGKSPIIPKIEGENACLGYAGISIDGVSIGPSPDWMQRRLNSLGIRPINNMVDIGNYVMLELGIPMHIFDRQKIKGGVIKIHQLKGPAELKMLDGTLAKLIPGDTLISDEHDPLVLAGIMGGEASGVSDSTKSIFIEVANWQAHLVRRTSTRLGIRTESSMRYEKSLDSNLLKRTAYRAAELVLEFCPSAKINGQFEFAGEQYLSKKPLEIETSYAAINKLLGTQIADAEIDRIFKALNFEVRKTKTTFKVTVPTYRATKDIQCEADLIEEIGRIVGYNNIEARPPLQEVAAVRLPNSRLLQRKVQDFMLLSARASEIMTYPLLGTKLLQQALWPDNNQQLKVVNAWSPDYDTMRSSLIPSALEAVALNQKHLENFRLFELGRSYLPVQDFRLERLQLIVALFDREANCFSEALNISERLLSYLNLSSVRLEDYQGKSKSIVPEGWTGIHPTLCQEVSARGKTIGIINQVTPPVLKSFKIRGHLSLALIDLHDFENEDLLPRHKFNALPRFPSASFDCTVVANRRVPVGNMLKIVQGLKQPEIENVRILTVFELPEEKKAVTLRAIFSDTERTLPGEKIKELEGGIINALGKAGYALR